MLHAFAAFDSVIDVDVYILALCDASCKCLLLLPAAAAADDVGSACRCGLQWSLEHEDWSSLCCVDDKYADKYAAL